MNFLKNIITYDIIQEVKNLLARVFNFEVLHAKKCKNTVFTAKFLILQRFCRQTKDFCLRNIIQEVKNLLARVFNFLVLRTAIPITKRFKKARYTKDLRL